jgi:hypothetical protein
MARLWVPLDVDFQHDDRVSALSLEAEVLYLRSLALAKRLGTDGRIRRSQLGPLSDKCKSAPEDLADELVGEELWALEEHGDPRRDRYRIVAWDRWNEPIEAEDRVRAGKSRGGKLGNHRKYNHPGSLDSCVKCFPPSDIRSDTDSDTDRSDRSLTDRSSSLETETETEKDKSSADSPANAVLSAAQEPLKLPTDGPDPVEAQFQLFWDEYPQRHGKKIGRGAALIEWRKLSHDQRQRAFRGAKNLASSDQLPKDAERFLRRKGGEFPFDEWQTPARHNDERTRRPTGTRGGVVG